MKLTARRIVSPTDKAYAECVKVYEESFPYEERRDTEEMSRYLSDPRFHFTVFFEEHEEDSPVGFFTFWDFGSGWLYGEHFAVNPSRRGHGTGAAILSYLKEMDIPMIFEIEPPYEDNCMTIRRKLFYERNGFILNPYEHVQPAYHEDSQPVPMRIMTWPYVFSEDEYIKFRDAQITIMP